MSTPITLVVKGHPPKPQPVLPKGGLAEPLQVLTESVP